MIKTTKLDKQLVGVLINTDFTKYKGFIYQLFQITKEASSLSRWQKYTKVHKFRPNAEAELVLAFTLAITRTLHVCLQKRKIAAMTMIDYQRFIYKHLAKKFFKKEVDFLDIILKRFKTNDFDTWAKENKQQTQRNLKIVKVVYDNIFERPKDQKYHDPLMLELMKIYFNACFKATELI